jgi:hypothetical protein
MLSAGFVASGYHPLVHRAEIVLQIHLALIEVDNAFVPFRGNILRDGRVDAHLGCGWDFAVDRPGSSHGV